MYFPQHTNQIPNFLKDLEHLSINEKLKVVDDAISMMSSEKRYFLVVKTLEGYRLSLQELKNHKIQESGEYRELAYKNRKLEEQILSLTKELEKRVTFSCDIKSYKNLYIYILSHPKKKSSATTEILSRINYLDKMTRDVVFVMPGYQRATANDEMVDIRDANLQLTFDETLFMETVQKLEDESKGKFRYNDKCELIIFGMDPNGEIDYSNFSRLDLNLLAKTREIDPIQLILKIANHFRESNDQIDIKNSINQILGEMTMNENSPYLRIFIAGAKSLRTERSLLRDVLNNLQRSAPKFVPEKTTETKKCLRNSKNDS